MPRDSSSSDSESESVSSEEEQKERGGLIQKYNRKHGERKKVGSSNKAKHGSSYLRLTTQGVDQFASTPVSILGELTQRYGPPLGWNKPLFDPCPEIYSGGKRVNHPEYNGLTQDWGRVSYVNPPYGKIKLWFPKAVEQQAKGNTSVFLVPLRPFTQYFLKIIKNISWIEVIYYGVGFKGYAGKIPHPMCTVCFLGKGVKDHPAFHRTMGNGENNKKWHNFSGTLPIRVPSRKYTFVQRVPPPCAFDTATQICEDNKIPKSRIHIMINSSNMTNAGYLDDDAIEKARGSWKHAYALLVPFYNYSCAFQKGMRDCSILAYSSPILCNYAGEGKCRFCSVLFVFCPTDDARFKKFISDKKLHPFRMCFNYNGYLPTKDELQAAKIKKIQSTKATHMSKQRGVMGKKKGGMVGGGFVTSNVKRKPKKSSGKKAKKPRAKKVSAKKPKRTAKTTPKKRKGPIKIDPEDAYQRVKTYCIQHRKLPSYECIRATFRISRQAAKKVVKELLVYIVAKKGIKRKAVRSPMKANKRQRVGPAQRVAAATAH